MNLSPLEIDQPRKPVRTFRQFRPFLLILVGVALILVLILLSTFISSVVFAVVLAIICSPLQDRLERLFRGRDTLAALVTTFLAALIVVIPILLLLSALTSQTVQLFQDLQEWVTGGGMQRLESHPLVHRMEMWIFRLAPTSGINLDDFKEQLAEISKTLPGSVLGQGAEIIANTFGFISRFFIMIFITFYLMRDGKKMTAHFKLLLPLRDQQKDQIVDKIRAVAKSVVLGSFLTAVSQGVVGGIGLSIAGIPGIFWGAITAFASLVPLVGTGLVYAPASVYLLILGKWKYAVFLAAWGVFVLNPIDNFVRPYFMQGTAKMSPFLLFLAIVGGIFYFGLAGIVYGPLIFAFAVVVLHIYKEEFVDPDIIK